MKSFFWTLLIIPSSLLPVVFSTSSYDTHLDIADVDVLADYPTEDLDEAYQLAKRQSVGAPFANSSSSGPPSPLVLPSPNVTSSGIWTEAVERAREFVAKLTLPEKINITTGVDLQGRCVGNTGMIPRLNFSGFCLHDSPLGVRFTDFVSAFPAALNAGLTWDRGLIYERAKAMGKEFRGKGINVALGPMMNLARAATGGRNWEGFGADPYLSAIAGALTTEGIQSTGVIACAKHYIANEQEHFRGGSVANGQNGRAASSDVDDRTMREIYLYPFEESVKANVGCVMCSYNRINGTFGCENSKLINGILKTELNYKGFLLSDWAAMVSGGPAALAGVDMNMPGFIGYGIGDQDDPDPSQANNTYWGAELLRLVQNGTVPEWRVDDMVIRAMTAYYKLEQDKEFPHTNFDYNTHDTYVNGVLRNEHVNVQADHYVLIREIGAASTVLLKNENGTLPIKFTKSEWMSPQWQKTFNYTQVPTYPKNVAILGSDAGPNPDGPNGCASGNTDRGCSQGTLAMGWGSGTAEFPYLIDPLSAITQWLRRESPGTVINSLLNDFNLIQARRVARQADLSIVFVNSDSGEGYINVDGNSGDRQNLTLWHGGDALINATASECKNTVVVIHAVGQVNVETWINHPNVTAVLFAGLPGQESGNGLVDVLSGAVNPSARLVFTIAKQDSDYSAQVVYEAPPDQNVIHIPYSEKLEIDYRHFDAHNVEPRFPFGFGLSYTTFEYSALSVTKSGALVKRVPRPQDPTTSSTPTSVTPPSAPTEAPPIPVPTGAVGGNPFLYQPALNVCFYVKNTGDLDGNEVAQVYLGFPEGSGEPPKLLRGFDRKLIKKRTSEKFSIDLRNKELAIWDVVKQKWVIPAGDFKVYVGASSRDIRLNTTFTVAESVPITPY